MTAAGWIFMITVWTAVIAVLVFCYYHVLRRNKLSGGGQAGAIDRGVD